MRVCECVPELVGRRIVPGKGVCLFVQLDVMLGSLGNNDIRLQNSRWGELKTNTRTHEPAHAQTSGME